MKIRNHAHAFVSFLIVAAVVSACAGSVWRAEAAKTIDEMAHANLELLRGGELPDTVSAETDTLCVTHEDWREIMGAVWNAVLYIEYMEQEESTRTGSWCVNYSPVCKALRNAHVLMHRIWERVEPPIRYD